MSYPILYTFRRCPYAMRARLALYLAKIEHEHREVELKDKPASLIELSPKATVPVLFFPDKNIILEQSLDIAFWALKNSTYMHPLNESNTKKKYFNLIAENDNEFKYNLDRYKYTNRYELSDSSIDYRAIALNFVAKLEQLLNQNFYLASENLSIVDISIFPYIRQFSSVGPRWFQKLEYKKTLDWLAKLKASKTFNQTMKKYNTWKIENSPIVLKF